MRTLQCKHIRHSAYKLGAASLLGVVLTFWAWDAHPSGGRYTYKGKVFPTASAACSALLADRSPPETLKEAGAPDKFGDVRCVGRTKDGQDGFDQYMNEVKFEEAPANEDSKPDAAIATPAVGKQSSAQPQCELDSLSGENLARTIVALLQQYTDESNAELIRNPKKAAKSVPSVGKGFFTGDYGLLVENLVAKRVQGNSCLEKHIRHLSVSEQSRRGPDGEKGSHPDFQGIGKLESLQIDVTTKEAKARKLANDGAKADYAYVTYERGLCLDQKTKLAVKIPKGADLNKTKNGDCPPNWK